MAFVAASFALWYKPLAATVEVAIASDAYTHILLIVPLCLALVYCAEKPALPTNPHPAWPGVALMSAGFLLRMLVFSTLRYPVTAHWSWQIFGLVLWWIGSVLLCFGFPRFQSLRFPLCFLFLFVPLPDPGVEWIRGFLQHQSAVATTVLFRAALVPVSRQGVLLSIPGLDIEVARECSSIRSSTILIVITLVLAHLFLRSGWRKTLLVLLSIPLSIFKNAVRIFVIAELGTRVDPGYLNGRLHHEGGSLFLGFALVADIALLWLLRRGEFERHEADFKT